MDKRVKKFQEDAILINESISWVEHKTNGALDELESIKDCNSFECEEKREKLMQEVEVYFTRLHHEDMLLEKYGRDLSQYMEVINNSGINF